MEIKMLSARELNNRKMLLVLPLLILPFVTLLFWVLGGGRGTAATNADAERTGLNMLLPNPKLTEDSALDKMSYYDQASLDSIKLQEQQKKDPNYAVGPGDENILAEQSAFDADAASWNGKYAGLNTAGLRPDNEKKMYEKLQALQKAIAEPPKSGRYGQDMGEFQNQKMPYGDAAEMKNLEQLMSAMSVPSEPDPELAQLGGMLENILDIQHPERVQEKLRQNSKLNKGKVFSVSRKADDQHISYFQSVDPAAGQRDSNSFYSMNADAVSDEAQNALQAVVHETQTIVNGSIVKIRLVNDIFINGVLIPKNSFVFGTASLKGERLEIKITTIKSQNSIFPVELSVFDIDGIKGINIPGTINRDVAKASADRSMQSIGLSGVSDSWGAQAAGMGVEAAKTLLSKKVKLIKVAVKAGYNVLLYDEKEKNEK